MNIIPFPTPAPDRTPDARYFLDTDYDSNWYVIPAMDRARWNLWLEANHNVYKPIVPPFARRIGNDVSKITFGGDYHVGR